MDLSFLTFKITIIVTINKQRKILKVAKYTLSILLLRKFVNNSYISSIYTQQQQLLILSRIECIFRFVRLRIVFSVVNSIITLDNVLIEKKKGTTNLKTQNITLIQ
jgi:hypothetical protein